MARASSRPGREGGWVGGWNSAIVEKAAVNLQVARTVSCPVGGRGQGGKCPALVGKKAAVNLLVARAVSSTGRDGGGLGWGCSATVTRQLSTHVWQGTVWRLAGVAVCTQTVSSHQWSWLRDAPVKTGG